MFVALLMMGVEENYGNFGGRRKYVAILQYLRSYINKSLLISDKKVSKIFSMLMALLKTGISSI
jgi:hypothetical protein